jgi:hypothetical protein
MDIVWFALDMSAVEQMKLPVYIIPLALHGRIRAAKANTKWIAETKVQTSFS